MNGGWTPKLDPEKQCIAIIHTFRGEKEIIINRPPCKYVKLPGRWSENPNVVEVQFERKEEIDGIFHYR